MTEAQLTAQLTSLEEQVSARQERVDGYRDQRKAKLFLESEWSQEQLAVFLTKFWGKETSADWVAKHLRLGRFVSFFNTSCIEDGSPDAPYALPANLTEGAFRRMWDATTASGNFSGHRANTEAAVEDEQRRFGEVLDALKESGLHRKKKKVQELIRKEFGGKQAWMTEEQMRDKLAAKSEGDWHREDVHKCLRTWQVSDRNPYRIEKCGEGHATKYRIVKVKGSLLSKKQLSAIAPELLPLLHDFLKESKKHRVERSDAAMIAAADKIAKLLETLTATVSADDESRQEV